MAFSSFKIQFFTYAGIVLIGAVWLKLLPYIPEDIHRDQYCFVKPAITLQKVESERSISSVNTEKTADAFFMTSVAAASGQSSSSLYCSVLGKASATSLTGSHGSGLLRMGKSSSREFNLSLVDRLEEADKIETSGSPDSPQYQGFDGHDHLVDIEAKNDITNIEQIVHVEEQLFGYGTEKIGISTGSEAPHYWSDIMISFMVLCIVGSGTAFSIYLETYVDDTSVIASNLKAMVLMVFFCSGTAANIAGIFIQISIYDNTLSRLTSCILIVGAFGVLLVMCFPKSSQVLWTGVALFGFSSAITVGFCFNIANRLSYPSATSTSIIMIGSSVGVSIIPYITSVLITVENDPGMIMLVSCICMIIPVFLLYGAIYCSYLAHSF